jgi:hypothetical protein
MIVPNCIFIDTSIFEQAGFNFESAKLKPFRDSLDDLKLTFVDPDPTLRERKRHLHDRVDEAVRSLEKIERSLPIITRLEKWPKASSFREWEVRRLVDKSLEQFLKPMKHVKLGYDGIDMNKVMTWYDQGRAPFGKGKKRKEFPDALAIAILDRYAKSNKCEIAVISADEDFERACSERTNLLYFSSLAAYLQVHQGESERVKLVQKWFADNPDAFDKWIDDEFTKIDIEIEESWDSEILDLQVDEVTINDFYVVAVADKECTVSFDADISFSVYIDYEDENEREYDYEGEPQGHPRKKCNISSTDSTSGLAKVRLDNSASTVEGIIYIDLDIASTSISLADAW